LNKLTCRYLATLPDIVLNSKPSTSLANSYDSPLPIKYSREEFLSWLAGFSEAEGCFKIKPKYREGKKTVHSFYFEFEIHLHIDDQNLLNHICATLGIGRVYLREKSKSCSFIVGNEAGIRSLLTIFDDHQFNGIKYLDYQDFKKAFLLYFDRSGTLNGDLTDKILKLHSSLNTGRTDFRMPDDHLVKITPYWFLGLIEGEGSFSLSRSPLRPHFQLLFTAAQEPLLLKVKEFLVENLGFDRFSNWQLVNSAVIGLSSIKAKGNSKPTVSLDIRDIKVLTNYLLPFLSKMKFFSKKELDFNDFFLICKTIYNGAHKNEVINNLVLKLSFSMNDFRLSSYNGKITKQVLTKEELTTLKTAVPLSLRLADGRVRDITTGKIDYNSESSCYLITRPGKEELIVKSLKEAGEIVGVHYSTLSKILDVDFADFVGDIRSTGHSVRRIKVFG